MMFANRRTSSVSNISAGNLVGLLSLRSLSAMIYGCFFFALLQAPLKMF